MIDPRSLEEGVHARLVGDGDRLAVDDVPYEVVVKDGSRSPSNPPDDEVSLAVTGVGNRRATVVSTELGAIADGLEG